MEQVTDQLERIIEQEQLQDSLTVRCIVSFRVFPVVTSRRQDLS